MNDRLSDYVKDPRDQMSNFNMGIYYEENKQYAAAVGFYIRTAEFGNDILLSYEALLRIAICLETQGRRSNPQRGILLKAISICPDRPEAYFLLCRYYENTKQWHEALAWSVVGEKIASSETTGKFITDVQYPGKYGFLYEKAVVSWWTGLYDYSLRLFKRLQENYKMMPIYEASVQSNLKNITSILKNKGKFLL